MKMRKIFHSVILIVVFSIPSFAQESNEDTFVSTPVYSLSINYKQFTELALKLLKKEVNDRSSSLFGTTPKEIKLTVVDVRLITKYFAYRCIINSTVETGDGYIRGFEVIGTSWRDETAIDTALSKVAISVLNDKGILNYLEK